jgi:hypothetical protein
MANIRDYIDIVERELSEGFIPRPQPAFGRKGTPTQTREPSNPTLKAELDQCRQYPSAEAYAGANNRFGRVNNYDPSDIQTNAAAEHHRLMDRWNHWQQAGLLAPHQR